MYLSDEETEQLLQKSLSWLTPGGTLFFRESCFHSSGSLDFIVKFIVLSEIQHRERFTVL